MGLFLGELAKPLPAAATGGPAGAPVVGYAGVLTSRTRATSPRWRSTRRGSAASIATRLMLVAQVARALGAGRSSADARGPHDATPAPRSCTGSSGSRPAGVRKGYYAENNEDALVMWAHDIDAPEMAAASTRSRPDAVAHAIRHEGPIRTARSTPTRDRRSAEHADGGPTTDQAPTRDRRLADRRRDHDPRHRDVVRRDGRRGGGRRPRGAVLGRVEPGRPPRPLRRRRARDRQPGPRRAA